MQKISISIAFIITLLSHIPELRATGVFNSVSYLALPPGFSLEVFPLDDSSASLEIKAELEAALHAKGFKTSERAPYVMNFAMRDRLGSLPTFGQSYIFSFESKGGQEGGENAKARINLFDSERGGLLNQERRGPKLNTLSIYRLETNIEVRSSGKLLWESWAESKLSQGTGLDLIRRMIPSIITNIGKTTTNALFSMD